MKKYCVMIDGSNLATQAAQLCATMVKSGDEVILYSSYYYCHYVGPYYNAGAILEPQNQSEEHKKIVMQAAQCFKGKTGVKLFSKVESATDVRATMVAFLQETKPDLVFMGNRGLGEVKGAFSSCSQYVLHHYESGGICIVRGYNAPTSTPDKPISKHYFICADGSDHSNRAAALLAGLATPVDSITIGSYGQAPPQFVDTGMDAMVALDPEGGAFGSWKLQENPDYDKQFAEATTQAQEVVTRTKEIIQAANKELTNFQEITKVVPEPVRTTCEDLAAAADVDVIVMGTRGRGLIKRLLMGSFSNQVFHSVEDKAFLIAH